MSQTVAGAGNGQSFHDELRAATSGALDTPGTIRTPEGRGASEVGPSALPGPLIPPPPPAPTAADGLRSMSVDPGQRPPTAHEAHVQQSVDRYLAAHPELLRPAGKPPKAPKPPKEPAEGPTRWQRVPLWVKGVGIVMVTLVGSGLLFSRCGYGKYDPEQANRDGYEAGFAAARDGFAATANDVLARKTQVYRPEPFANLCVCELTDGAKAIITYEPPNHTELFGDRARIVADQVKQLQGTGLWTIADYHLDAHGATGLEVITFYREGAVKLFKTQTTTPAPTTTVAGG